jgi:hypothetical protein
VAVRKGPLFDIRGSVLAEVRADGRRSTENVKLLQRTRLDAAPSRMGGTAPDFALALRPADGALRSFDRCSRADVLSAARYLSGRAPIPEFKET